MQLYVLPCDYILDQTFLTARSRYTSEHKHLDMIGAPEYPLQVTV
jgi:hypothetical protein